jgi:hypothetical protein
MSDGALEAGRIASRFQDLQGLRLAVGGVGLLLLFAWEMAFPLTLSDLAAAGGPNPWAYALLLAGCAVLVGGVLWINGWYRRNYGAVVRTRKQNRVGALLAGAGLLAFLVPFEAETFALSSGHTLPANLALFTMALWIVGYWLYLGRTFSHYLVIAGVGFLLGLASIAGVPPATFDWHVREVTLYFGLASLAGGVIDHLILTRSMPSSETSVASDS